MTFKIESGWFLLALLLIATSLVFLTVNSLDIGNAYIKQAKAGKDNFTLFLLGLIMWLPLFLIT